MKFKNLKLFGIGLLVVALVIIAGCTSTPNFNIDEEITIYKTPNCGCCTVYTSYANNQGLNVNVEEVSSLEFIFSKYNVSNELLSCHVSEIGGYIVVGHVPLEAVEKLLTEKPDIVGISLPDMPSGSPGMPGQKNGEWVIYSIQNDGGYTEFTRI